jgi:hypothetical protein
MYAVIVLASCEQVELKPYEGDPYVGFYDPRGFYMKQLQSAETNFVYMDESIVRDTVWFKIVAKASIPPADYHVKIRAYKNEISYLTNLKEAEPGIHYVPFDSKEMEDFLILKKGHLYDSIPVILLRDPSLKEEGRRLTLRITDSEDLKASDRLADDDQSHTFVVVYMADCFLEPANWKYSSLGLGKYGPVKHQFMVEQSGERWDNNFISTLDRYDKTYYAFKFRNALVLENQKRAAQGLPKLKEKDGTDVEFS